jgi:hypothetical protein
MVSDWFYSYLKYLEWNFGHRKSVFTTLKHSHLKWQLSLLDFSLENFKDIFLSLARRFMYFAVAVLDGMIDLSTVFMALGFFSSLTPSSG